MFKKIAGVLISGVAVLALSGCGSSSDDYYEPLPPPPVVEETTLFLIDGAGTGVEFVPYTCYTPDGVVVTDSVTPINGEFSFIPGDRCEFDFFGFPGDIVYPLYVADIDGFGKDDIPYGCVNDLDVFTEGRTDFDGYFAYPVDAVCKFYL